MSDLSQTIYVGTPFSNAPVDPLWSNVILSVTGVGANGATAFPDLSPLNLGNGTATGGVALTTTSPIAGNTSSILTNGTSAYARWPNPTIPDPSTPSVPWTVEMLWNPGGPGSVFGWGQDWGGVGTYGGFVQSIAGGSFRCYNGMPAGVNGFDFSSAASVWTADNDYYLCLESNGTKVRLYLGLKSGGTFAMVASGTPAGNDSNAFGDRFQVGWYGFAGYSAGRFNHIRITQNVARYNSDVGGTIPITPFPTSA